MGWFHDPGSTALSDPGAHRGPDLQLVESVHQVGHPQKAYGGDDQSAAAAPRDRPPNQAQQPDHSDHHQQSRASGADPPRAGERQPLLAKTCGICGAVYCRSTLALAPTLHFSGLARETLLRSEKTPLDRHRQLPDLGLMGIIGGHVDLTSWYRGHQGPTQAAVALGA